MQSGSMSCAGRGSLMSLSTRVENNGAGGLSGLGGSYCHQIVTTADFVGVSGLRGFCRISKLMQEKATHGFQIPPAAPKPIKPFATESVYSSDICKMNRARQSLVCLQAR